jgi:hypothetical protein
MKVAWFATLIATICFEGLGRKFLPTVPSAAFYFLKDVVLLIGWLRFRPPAPLRTAARRLYRGFEVIWLLGFAWTVIELFNPAQTSGVLAAIGFRAYWLWWIAPPLIAHVLRDAKDRRRAIYVLLFTGAAVATFAAIQFVAPSDSSLTVYSYVDGERVDQVMISETGRGRVSSTFAFISGFCDFSILIPTLLLSLGLDAKEPRLRKLAFIVTGMTAAVLPMSGSRLSVLVGGGILLLSVWTAGLFFTRVGRRLLIGGVAAAIISVVAFPDALAGVGVRFQDEAETQHRYLLTAASVLPPLAIAMVDHPALGIGTGMLQNARMALHVDVPYEVEQEFERYLVELGTMGFILLWSIKFGLSVALYRAYLLLKRAGRRGAATAALSYAILTMIGNITFDHIWQALYFIGCGFILAEIAAVLRERAAARAVEPTESAPAAVAVAATWAPAGR